MRDYQITREEWANWWKSTRPTWNLPHTDHVVLKMYFLTALNLSIFHLKFSTLQCAPQFPCLHGSSNQKKSPKKIILISQNKDMHQPMSCCSILYPVNLRKNVTVISYCSFILDRHVRKVFFFRSSHKQGTKKKCWVMKSQTSDPCALMLCNWATETPRWAKSLLHTARIKNVESFMCRIIKWWIVSSVVKWIKMFSAFGISSVERKEKIGLNIFLTPLTRTKLSTLLILAVRGIVSFTSLISAWLRLQ